MTMTRDEPGTARLLAGWQRAGRPADFAEHLARYGPLPASGPDLIDRIDAAGLRGRGGAGFPTAIKMRAVAAGRRRGVVIANGCEAEPASQKDHALLSVAPHLVFDGAQLAARAVGAASVVLCVHRDDPLAASVATALAQRRGDPVPTRIVEVPARFVASEESALVNFVNTGIAKPTAKPPRPVERGVRGRPTLVDNVETLANIALLARGDESGSMLVTVGGAVRVPGVHEVGLGSAVGAVFATAGGQTQPLQAVLAGGYGGSWLPLPAASGFSLGHNNFRGLGLLLALPSRACGIAETASILRYLADESARQCGPCMFGLPAIAQDFALLATGRVDRPAMHRLHARLGVIPGRGACGHPDGAVRLAASALRVFERDVHMHAMGRPCVFAAERPWFVPRPRLRETGWS